MPTVDIKGTKFDFNGDPDHCPRCHHGIEPIRIGSNVANKDDYSVLQILYRCPRSVCEEAFIANYRQNLNQYHHRYEGVFILRSTVPFRPQEPDIPSEIKKVSPNYFEVYSQSVAAEAYQLDQIAGVGYRKALEYLIKDYAIHKNEGKTKEIKEAFLGACIDNYVDDTNVKACAKRATWLGNDETHYVRKWEEKDINDLKALIELTQAWITTNLLTEKYLKEMK